MISDVFYKVSILSLSAAGMSVLGVASSNLYSMITTPDAVALPSLSVCFIGAFALTSCVGVAAALSGEVLSARERQRVDTPTYKR